MLLNCGFRPPKSGLTMSEMGTAKIPCSGQWWNFYRVKKPTRTRGHPRTEKPVGYGNGQKHTSFRMGFSTTGHRVARCVFRRPRGQRSFEKHTTLFSEVGMLVSIRLQRQLLPDTIGPD